MFTFYSVQATGGAAQLEASDPTTAQGGCTGALCHPALSHLRSPHPSASWSPQSRGQALSPPARLRSAPSQVRSPLSLPSSLLCPHILLAGPTISDTSLQAQLNATSYRKPPGSLEPLGTFLPGSPALGPGGTMGLARQRLASLFLTSLRT